MSTASKLFAAEEELVNGMADMSLSQKQVQ
jgi:hypothetical protein